MSALFLLAGLAFFLFGIDVLGKLLTTLVGGNLQEKLLYYTRKDISKVSVGIIITTLFQSSSATTVLLVSMASAGFISVFESVSFILGANIGSVSTAWIVAVKITKAALPLFVVGVVGNFFVTKQKWQQLFNFFTGLGLIFYGLEMMSNSLEFVKHSTQVINFIQQFNAQTTISSMLILVLFGIVFTAIIQSSGATAAMVIVASINGVFNFHSAGAVVLGATLGTTITAFIASIGGSRDGRRVALIQVGINIIGIIIGILLFYPMIGFVHFIVLKMHGNISIMIALYMTLLKIILVSIVFPFRKKVALITFKIVKERFPDINLRLDIEDIPKGTKHIVVNNMLSQNIDIFIKYLTDMLAFSYIVLKKPKEKDLFDKIVKYEKFIDAGHKKIVSVISKAKIKETELLWLYLKMSDEAESISDHIRELAKYSIKLNQKEVEIPDYFKELLMDAHIRVFTLFHDVVVKKQYNETFFSTIRSNEHFLRRKKRKMMIRLAKNSSEKFEIELIIADILSEYSKINHSIKRILQVNLDILEGKGIYVWKKV